MCKNHRFVFAILTGPLNKFLRVFPVTVNQQLIVFEVSWGNRFKDSVFATHYIGFCCSTLPDTNFTSTPILHISEVKKGTAQLICHICINVLTTWQSFQLFSSLVHELILVFTETGEKSQRWLWSHTIAHTWINFLFIWISKKFK